MDDVEENPNGLETNNTQNRFEVIPMDILEKIISWLVPFLLGSMISGITLWFTGLKAIRNGLQCLLRAEIVRQHEKWTRAEYCPIYAKEALTREYKAYHALKGNDVATGLYEEIMDLPERKGY